MSTTPIIETSQAIQNNCFAVKTTIDSAEGLLCLINYCPPKDKDDSSFKIDFKITHTNEDCSEHIYKIDNSSFTSLYELLRYHKGFNEKGISKKINSFLDKINKDNASEEELEYRISKYFSLQLTVNGRPTYKTRGCFFKNRLRKWSGELFDKRPVLPNEINTKAIEVVKKIDSAWSKKDNIINVKRCLESSTNVSLIGNIVTNCLIMETEKLQKISDFVQTLNVIETPQQPTTITTPEEKTNLNNQEIIQVQKKSKLEVENNSTIAESETTEKKPVSPPVSEMKIINFENDVDQSIKKQEKIIAKDTYHDMEEEQQEEEERNQDD